MGTDKINSNDPLFYVNKPVSDWAKLKPYNFTEDFAQWRRNKNNKTDELTKPNLTNHCSQYNNLLKIEYPQGANVSQKFFDKVYEISNNLGTRKNKIVHCNVNNLLAIMYNESKFDSKLVSNSGKYAGLIQIDKTTYDVIFKNNKCSYEQFKKMPREKQLSFIQDYLKYRIKTAGNKLDKYIDENGNIDGGALFTLVWRPGDFETKTEEEVAKKVRMKQNTINKIQAKLARANEYTQYINQKA